MKTLVAALALLACAAPAGATTPARTHGTAIVGGTKLQVRYAAAFTLGNSTGYGGWGVVLSDKPLRCSKLGDLPAGNKLGGRWALVALFPTKDGFPLPGPARGQVDYPVGSDYASLSRGVSIELWSVGYSGVIWSGRVDQPARRIDGKLYSVHAVFAARWCG